MAQVFNDTFARVDGTVGNGWTDSDGGFAISSNKLVTPHDVTARITRDDLGVGAGVRFTWKMNWSHSSYAGTRNFYVLALSDGTTANGLGIRISQSPGPTYNYEIVDNGTVKSSAALGDAGRDGITTADCELVVNTDGSVEFRKWDTASGSRPTDPDLECAAFSPTASGDKWTIEVTNSGTSGGDAFTYYFTVDDISQAFTVADIVNASDSAVGTRQVSFTVADTISLTEAETTGAGRFFSVTDTVTTSDSTTVSTPWLRQVKTANTADATNFIFMDEDQYIFMDGNELVFTEGDQGWTYTTKT